MDAPAPAAAPLVYPESDGLPVADNTLQWDWIVKIVGELRELFRGQDVFVAGDLFWYPVEGSLDRAAPDALVAFDRPQRYRGSYKQWEEGNVAPQVVFDRVSRSTTREEVAAKRRWYTQHGVEEYYMIDAQRHRIIGLVRDGDRLEVVDLIDEFVSPRLGIRFETRPLNIYRPDGREFCYPECDIAHIVHAPW